MFSFLLSSSFFLFLLLMMMINGFIFLNMVAATEGTQKETFLIALQAPITGVGQIFPDMRGWNKTFHFTIEEINNSSEILPNITLTTTWADTACIPMRAVSPCMEISGSMNGKPKAIALIGDVCSDVSKMSAAILPAFQIPQISFGSSTPQLSNKANYPFFLRTAPSDYFLAKAVAHFLYEDMQFRKVAAIAAKDSKSTDGINAFVNEFTVRRQGQVLALQFFEEKSLASDRSFDAQLQAIKDSGARVIVSNAKPDDMNEYMKACIVYGLTGPPYVHIVMEMNRFTEYLFHDVTNATKCGELCDLETAKKGTDGIVGFDKLNLPLTEQDIVTYKSFTTKLEQAKIDPTQVYITYLYDAIWTVAIVMDEMIQKKQEDVRNGTLLLQNLLKFQHPGFSGTGNIAFDVNGDRIPRFLIYNFHQENPHIIGYSIPNPTQKGSFFTNLTQNPIWSQGRKEIPSDTPHQCKQGYISIGWEECIPFIVVSSNGNFYWLDVGLAAIALFLVGFILWQTKKKQIEFVFTISKILNGPFIQVFKLFFEISDVFSDLMTASFLLFFQKETLWLDHTFKTVYAIFVCLGFIPSMIYIRSGILTLKEFFAHGNSINTSNTGIYSSNNTGTNKPRSMNTTGNGSKKKIAVTIEMIPDTQTTTTSQMAGTEIVVADETKEWLYEEIQTVEARILEDLKHSHIIAITLLYLILEVIPMIIWNSTILITQINEKAFRESSLITLIHLSLASSLVCFGLKTSSLMTWMGKGRNTLKSQKRYLILLKLIRDSNKEISCIDQTFLALLKKEEQENESVNRKGIEFLRLRLQ